jgi:hypothetical protein
MPGSLEVVQALLPLPIGVEQSWPRHVIYGLDRPHALRTSEVFRRELIGG